MSKHARLGLVGLGAIVIIILAIAIPWHHNIQYGISPFQDTAMPKVAEGLGLYKKRGLNVDLVTVAWEDIVPSVASGGHAIDLGIGSINTFLPRATNINIQGGGDVVFYYPLYVFKGASLVTPGDSGIQPLTHFLSKHPDDRNTAIREAMQQLLGKTVAIPSGTPYEQMLFAALNLAGMSDKDIDLRDTKLSESLYAFTNRQAVVVGAGVTQRTEALRQGGVVFLDMETLGFAEIIGIVTTRHFAQKHKKELDQLINIWFESLNVLLSDVDANSSYVLQYLAEHASTKYTPDEYKTSLGYQLFPRSTSEVRAKILFPDGTFYWKRTWDGVNAYLMALPKNKGGIDKPISYDYFLGETVDQGIGP